MHRTTNEKQNSKWNVAIFFGGCSSEYSVSLESASAVLKNLDLTRYQPIPVGITKDGDWFYFNGDISLIQTDQWHASKDIVPAVLSPCRSDHGLLLLKESGVERIPIDVAFPVLHGKNGEDGTLQGLIALAKIPLAGCGVLSSALCMDKDRAHILASAAGVSVPKSICLSAQDLSDKAGTDLFQAKNACKNMSPEASMDSISEDPMVSSSAWKKILNFAEETGYPIFVKPVKAGSSYGITRVIKEEELLPALRLALQYDDEIILEEAIEGFEVGCAVLGCGKLLVGEIDEIELSGGFFDFAEKYTLKTSAIHVPARISPQKAKELKTTAKAIYRALDCSGFARVDMFLTPDGRIVFNEVNTIPGFTEHSRYPGMMKAAGIGFADVISRIIEQAVQP